MKLEYFALGFALIAVGIVGFYYLDGQLSAQMASYEAGGEFLYSGDDGPDGQGPHRALCYRACRRRHCRVWGYRKAQGKSC